MGEKVINYTLPSFSMSSISSRSWPVCVFFVVFVVFVVYDARDCRVWKNRGFKNICWRKDIGIKLCVQGKCRPVFPRKASESRVKTFLPFQPYPSSTPYISIDNRHKSQSNVSVWFNLYYQVQQEEAKRLVPTSIGSWWCWWSLPTSTTSGVSRQDHSSTVTKFEEFGNRDCYVPKAWGVRPSSLGAQSSARQRRARWYRPRITVGDWAWLRETLVRDGLGVRLTLSK